MRPLLQPLASSAFLASALALTLLIFFLYSNGLNNEFTLDDGPVLLRNPFVQDPGRLGQLWTHQNWMPELPVSVYRPLTVLSFALNRAVASAPFAFRIVNLLLHLLCSLLLLLLARQILDSDRGAFWAALAFAVHPIHTEAVVSIVGRAELLSTFFSWLSLWLCLESLRSGRSRGWVCAGILLLGLLCKEAAASALPLLALAYALHAPAAPSRKRACLQFSRFLAPLLLACGLYFLLRFLALGGLAQALGSHPVDKLDNPLRYLPFPERPLTALHVFGIAFGLLVAPIRLSADYSFDAIPAVSSVLDLRALLPLLGLAGMLGAAVASARASKPMLWAIALFLAPYLLVSNWLLSGWTIFGERLLYAPSGGLCLALGLGLSRLGGAARRKAEALLLLFCLALGARTIQRNSDWKDELTLCQSSLEAAPDSAKLWQNLANQQYLRKRPDLALPSILKAIRIYPEFGMFHLLLGAIYIDLRETAKAAEALKTAERLMPGDTRAHVLLDRLSLAPKGLQP